MPLLFTDQQRQHYSGNIIQGTGYLVYRDIPWFCDSNQISTHKVLDLGCGPAGRSMAVLSEISHEVIGCDVSAEVLESARRKHPGLTHFLNQPERPYPHSPYNSIFAILSLFHLTSENEIAQEFSQCYNALASGGHLVIINGTKNVFTRNYATVVGQTAPEQDGDVGHVYLNNIDCEVTSYYWSVDKLTEIGKTVGLSYESCHYPLGSEKDGQGYIDEYEYPPYFYLALRKVNG